MWKFPKIGLYSHGFKFRGGTGLQPVLAISKSGNLGNPTLFFALAIEHGLEARATMKVRDAHATFFLNRLMWIPQNQPGIVATVPGVSNGHWGGC